MHVTNCIISSIFANFVHVYAWQLSLFDTRKNLPYKGKKAKYEYELMYPFL